jgi:hypothetical protein
MRYRVALVLAALNLGIATEESIAQIIQQQTVQLPTFHYFGVSTTVVVPTRGTIPIGSVTRSGMHRTPFDKVGSSSLGRSSQVGGLQMGVTVIDHAEIDRQLLAEAARRRGAKFDILGRPVDADEKDVQLRHARDAEDTGQTEAAKIFYRRVAKFGNLQQRLAAESRLAELEHKVKAK